MDFFYKHKTIIFLILFLLFSIFLGFILYSIFFHDPTKSVTSTDPAGLPSGGFPVPDDGQGQIIEPGGDGSFPFQKEPDALPQDGSSPIANGGLTQTTTLNNVPGSNFTSSSDGNSLQYYDLYDGKFYKIDNDGNKVALSDRVFYQVESVAWANGKNKAVIEYPDGANIVYDFDKEKQITLPKHWEDFEFSPNDQQLVSKSIGLDPDNRWLTISNADGSNTKGIEPLGTNADSVYSSWSPNNQSVAMFTEGIDFNRQKVYFVGKNQENFKATVVEGRGFQPLWAPDGTRLVYSVYSSDNQMKPQLWTVNAQGENIGQARRSLGLETWASKCNFSSKDNIYCAVPQNLEEGAGLFPELANATTDLIYKVNITTGIKKLISIPDKPFTISNIVVSDDEKTLFFVDKATDLVHKIDM